MIVCPQCGVELSGGRFCVQCGASLTPSDSDPSRASSGRNGFGAYLFKRTILFAIKIALFVLIWKLDPLGRFVETKKTLFALLVPFVAYALAALICAPFKIVLTVRRLREVRSSLTRWLLAWFLTIVARIWLGVCPAGLFFLMFYDYGPTIYPRLVIMAISMAPLATSAAYAFEFFLLRKPDAKFYDLRNRSEIV